MHLKSSPASITQSITLALIVLPHPPILTTLFALLDQIDLVSLPLHSAREKEIVHLLARAVLAGLLASSLHIVLINVFVAFSPSVSAICNATKTWKEYLVAAAHTDLVQRLPAVVVTTVTLPGGREPGKQHRQGGERELHGGSDGWG